METDPRSNIANPSSAIAATAGDTTSTTTTTSESTNITTNEQTTESRRDILPIIYDVRSIPTIGSGGSTQVNRGGPPRQRPQMSSMFTEKEAFEIFI
jgi:hypothetical protein